MSAEALKLKTKTLRFQVHSGAAVQEVELSHVVDGPNSDYAAGIYTLAEARFRNPQNVSELVLAISGEKDFPGAVLDELEEIAPDAVIDDVAAAMMADDEAFDKVAGLSIEERQWLAMDYVAHEQQQRANERTAGQVTTRQLIQPPSTREPAPTLALAA